MAQRRVSLGFPLYQTQIPDNLYAPNKEIVKFYGMNMQTFTYKRIIRDSPGRVCVDSGSNKERLAAIPKTSQGKKHITKTS